MSQRPRNKSERRSNNQAASRRRATQSQVAEVRPDLLQTSEILLVIGDEQQLIDPARLLEEDHPKELRQMIAESASSALVVVNGLLELDDAALWSVLKFLKGTSVEYVLETSAGQQTYQNLFQACLRLVDAYENLDRTGRARHVAQAAAVLVHPQALLEAIGQLHKRLREVGISGWTERKLLSEAKKIQALLRQTDGGFEYEVPAGVKDALEGEAPVRDDAVVPKKWQLSYDGVYFNTGDEESGDRDAVISTPVVITALLRGVDTEEESVEIAWLSRGAWVTRTVSRATIASSRMIVPELAKHGLPVTSNNAPTVVQYLADYVAANQAHLPRVNMSSQLGWQGTGKSRGFLLGHRYIDSSGKVTNTDELDFSQPDLPPDIVVFRGRDHGDEQIAAGFRSAGRPDKWKEAIDRLAEFPRIRLALYASLVPPLLEIFDAPNFVVDFSGTTSTGKTTALRFAASCWGKPEIASPESVISTWDSTKVARERRMGVQNSLPVLVDDTKTAKKTQEIPDTIYAFSTGSGRSRGSVGGLARTATFRSVLLMNGEMPATNFSQAGGVWARTLTLWGPPFGETSNRVGQLITGVQREIMQNYGHAGRRFIQFLLRNQKHWKAWRERYRESQDRYTQRAGNNQVALRLAPVFAVLDMAAWLASKAKVLPWDYADPVVELWDLLVREASQADRAAAALEHVMSWATARQEHFYSNHDTNRRPPNIGWAGRWDLAQVPGDGAETVPSWPWIGFFEPQLKQILQEGQFDVEAVLRNWLDRGWLRTSSGRTRYRARINLSLPWLVAITREAVREVEEGPVVPVTDDDNQQDDEAVADGADAGDDAEP